MFTGASKKKTIGNGLAAGCQLFYRKIYGYFLQCTFMKLCYNWFMNEAAKAMTKGKHTYISAYVRA